MRILRSALGFPKRWTQQASTSEVSGWVAEHPSRFAGLAAVDLNKPMAAARELRRRVEQLGFKGLRVLPWLWVAPPTDRRCYPLYASCVELGDIGYPFLYGLNG